MNFLKFTKKSKSNYPTMQSGRSMSEMLGVLAIVGLLSIGGLLAYRLGMNRHNANSILDDVNRFAFVMQERSDSLPLNALVNKGDFSVNGPFGMEGFVGSAPEYFSIKVFNIPEGVCDALLEKASVGYVVRVNPNGATGRLYVSTNQDLCVGNNDVVLYFGDTDYLEDEIVSTLAGEGGEGNEGGETPACPNGQHLENGDCVACPSIPNCQNYDQSCKCTGCDDYYDLTTTGVCCPYVTNCQSYGEGC